MSAFSFAAFSSAAFSLSAFSFADFSFAAFSFPAFSFAAFSFSAFSFPAFSFAALSFAALSFPLRRKLRDGFPCAQEGYPAQVTQCHLHDSTYTVPPEKRREASTLGKGLIWQIWMVNEGKHGGASITFPDESKEKKGGLFFISPPPSPLKVNATLASSPLRTALCGRVPCHTFSFVRVSSNPACICCPCLSVFARILSAS